MLEGVYLLTLVLTVEPLDSPWRNRSMEFSTYHDCMKAGSLAATFIGEEFRLTCTNKATGEVGGEWFMGVGDEQTGKETDKGR